jgi:hypothetical protein
MPNGTDFTAFKAAGYAGLNFAFLGSFQNYHRPTDDIQHLSQRSLRHEGETALALAQTLGNNAIATSHADGIYFDVWSYFVVRYPIRLAMPLAWLTAAVVAGVVAVAARRRAAMGRMLVEMLAGIGVAAVGIIISAALAWATAQAMGRPGAERDFNWLCAVAVVYAAAAAVALQWLVQRWIAAEATACGMLAVWAGAGLVVAHAQPLASYLFVFTVWLVAIATLVAMMCPCRASISFTIPTALAAAALALNAGHVYLASLAVEANGLHWIVAAEALILWLATPVLFLAVIGNTKQVLVPVRSGEL